MHRHLYVLLVAALLILSGCASSLHDQGRKLLAQQDYAGAAEVLQRALEKDPHNSVLLVELAAALYHQEELESARTYLEQARAQNPNDGEAVLLLGLVHEKSGDANAAIKVYRSYAQMSRLDRTRKVIKARMDQLIRKQIRAQTRKALAQEALLDPASTPDNAVAVAPFRNLGENRSLDPLQKGLAEMMVTDLSKVRALQVVERLRMQEMMREIGLGQTGAVDPTTAPRLGKLLGASQIINGSFADLAAEQLRLDISVAALKSDEVDATQTQGPLARLFRLQKELTFALIKEMGIELSDAERDAIQKIPTENLLAFIAYSKGLDLEDQGQSTAAASAFEEATALDPEFAAAHEHLERVEGAALGAANLGAVERVVFEEKPVREQGLADQFGAPPTATEVAQKARGTLDRLVATGQNAGAGFIPVLQQTQKEVRKPIHEHLDELEKINFGRREATLEIVVPLED
jgi:tetratricopeptide (TPR) repeat protein